MVLENALLPQTLQRRRSLWMGSCSLWIQAIANLRYLQPGCYFLLLLCTILIETIFSMNYSLDPFLKFF